MLELKTKADWKVSQLCYWPDAHEWIERHSCGDLFVCMCWEQDKGSLQLLPSSVPSMEQSLCHQLWDGLCETWQLRSEGCVLFYPQQPLTGLVFPNQRLELCRAWTGRACSDFTHRELIKDLWGLWSGSSMCVRNEDFYFTRWMSHKDSSFSQFLSIKIIYRIKTQEGQVRESDLVNGTWWLFMEAGLSFLHADLPSYLNLESRRKEQNPWEPVLPALWSCDH